MLTVIDGPGNVCSSLVASVNYDWMQFVHILYLMASGN